MLAQDATKQLYRGLLVAMAEETKNLLPQDYDVLRRAANVLAALHALRCARASTPRLALICPREKS